MNLWTQFCVSGQSSCRFRSATLAILISGVELYNPEGLPRRARSEALQARQDITTYSEFRKASRFARSVALSC
jgi:hypothetical protein